MEKEIYLRLLTGKVVGKAVADLGVNKLAIVHPKNIICASIAAATGASFLNHTEGVTRTFMNDDTEKLVEELSDYGADVILLQYGGESPVEETKKAFVELMKKMAEEGVEGDIIIHVRTYLMGAFEEALQDEAVHEYLSERGVFVYTLDAEEGKFYMNEFLEGEEEYILAPVLEYDISVEHSKLLKESLKK